MGPEARERGPTQGMSTGDRRESINEEPVGARLWSYRGAQLTTSPLQRVGAALRVVVLCNKGVLHLGVRGHQEAPVRQ